MHKRRKRARKPAPYAGQSAPPAERKPVTIGDWLNSAPNARVTRNELMRWAEGMTVMTRPDVIDMLREYEHLRRWRRTKAFFDVSRSPIWQAIRRSMFEKRDLATLSKEARDKVRDKLDEIEAEAATPPEPEENPDA